MKKFNIIYADPAWKYENEKDNNPAMGGMTYPTMNKYELAALPVKKIADRNCLLFLWVTMPKLFEAQMVMEAWGFNYITCPFVWVKTNRKNGGIYSGLGHWTNGNAELCLMGKKGIIKREQKNIKQIIESDHPEVLYSPVKRHSEKPQEVRDRIVQLVGDIPRIELFARQKVDGWDSFGNEIESDIQLV